MDMVLESVLGALVTVGTGLLAGTLMLRPESLVASLVPACALLLGCMVGVMLRRRSGAGNWRTLGLIAGSGVLAGVGAMASGPILYSLLSILSLIGSVGVLLLLISSRLGGMNRRAVAEVLSLPILGALQMAFCGGWLLSRGSLGREIVPQDQSLLSLAILAIVVRCWFFAAGRTRSRARTAYCSCRPVCRVGAMWVSAISRPGASRWASRGCC